MADIVHRELSKSTEFCSRPIQGKRISGRMAWSLFDNEGRRKYLTASERAAFMRAALHAGGPTGTFCLTLALTGARISEVLHLTPNRIDTGTNTIVLETLKRRERGQFRAIPVPCELIRSLEITHGLSGRGDGKRLWRWGRTTAWKRVKTVMASADILPALAKPKSLRHAFGVEAVRNRIALSVVKKWLGHAKIETTAIYADPVGKEERTLARLMWQNLPRNIRC